MEKEVVDILEMGLDQKRHQIRNILQSYHHEWDVLAELCQNAVDAVRERKYPEGEKPKIEIEIDQKRHALTVRDNGVGMTLVQAKQWVRPHSTSKYKNNRLIGEKGVGLTFAIFSCNDFQIRSRAGEEGNVVEGVLSNALKWVEEDGADYPKLLVGESPNKKFSIGTEVMLRDIGVHKKFFDLTYKQLIFILRTRTAIGSTAKLFKDETTDIEVTFSLVPKEGATTSELCDSEYLAPDLLTKDIIDFSKFREWVDAGTRSEEQQRTKLRGNFIAYRGERDYTGEGSSRKIKFALFFNPQWEEWVNLSKQFGLLNDASIDDVEEDDDYVLANTFTLAVRGMPTGVVLQHPRTYSSARWKNILLILQDDEAELDIGRKTVSEEQADAYREIAREIFKDLLTSPKYGYERLFGKTESAGSSEDVISSIQDALELTDLGHEFLAYKKVPAGQEAAVAAIFFEAIGSGIIKKIQPLYTSYGAQYDLIAKVPVGDKMIAKVFEFKVALKDFLKDVDNEAKYVNDISGLVCWEISDQDIKAAARREIDFGEIGKKEPNSIPHATHWLKVRHNKKVYVLELKSILTRHGEAS